ncbi:MAG UNVERIFIED_CONTAM: twin-arginine translocation signal domain-containing protein [Planctomycetaceae bacterium]|jgi:hypothetical protein
MTTTPTGSSRRGFLSTSTAGVATAGILSAAAPRLHAAEDNTIQIALVGCGGRGTGAVANAFAVDNGPLKLVAMADVFQKNLDGSYGRLNADHGQSGKMDVPPERRFVGFDAYKQAMDCPQAG